MIVKEPYFLATKTVLDQLQTSSEGLTNQEARRRQKRFGLNEPIQARKRSRIFLALGQFANPLIYLLFIASLVNFFLGRQIDTIIILAIVFINAAIGFLQENKAENALEALKKVMSLRTKVIRNGHEEEIPSIELVPGDLVVLEPGMKISADLRLIRADSLKIDESLLTGESVPSYKNPGILPEKTPLAEQKNMAFSGTLVVTGRGLGVVTTTGRKTELGKIATEVAESQQEPTPIHKKLSTFSRTVLIFTILVCGLIFVIGSLRGVGFAQIFLTSVAAAVSAIPEGLPAIITITFSIGVHRMVQQKALTRRLSSVETLGSVTVIASDKTGTLTHNQMTLERLVLNGETIKVSGDGYEPVGNFNLLDGKKISTNNTILQKFNIISVLCSNSQIYEENGIWFSQGDPTESALICAAQKAGIHQTTINQNNPRLAEIPFSEDKLYMATLNQGRLKNLIAVKGTLEKILERSTWFMGEKRKEKLTTTKKEQIMATANMLAKDSYRIIACAYREKPKSKKGFSDKDIGDLVFVGYAGLDDPPRQEVLEAIKNCQQAGIRVLMLTGDYPETARAIGYKLNIIGEKGKVISGAELNNLTDKQLAELLNNVAVFARITPRQKLRIVEALQGQGEIVGVTGDGVNDAPILEKADIGISMGLGGTDAAREASDMILLDNNFATIIKAIEEGRTILQNIKRAIFFLLSTSAGELLILLVALLVGLPMALTPIQILWINFITDTSSGMALAMEPKHPEVLSSPPRPPKESLLNSIIAVRILLVALVMTAGTMIVYYFEIKNGVSLEKARSVAFALMSVFQLFNLFNCRSFRLSAFQSKPFSNKWIWLSFCFSFILTFLTIQSGLLQKLFHTVSLDWSKWLLIILVSLSVVVVVEIEKLIRRWFGTKY